MKNPYDKMIGKANKAVGKRMTEKKIADSALGNPFRTLANLKKSDYEKVGMKNKDIDKHKERSKDFVIDTSSMFTDNPWYNIGLSLGRRKKAKRGKA